MSRKTPVTSIVGSQSKEEFISWTIDNNSKIHESPGRKPEWHFVKGWFYNAEVLATPVNSVPSRHMA